RGDQQFIVEEGTVVRERQPIIRLPNADSMRVNLAINESLIQYIRPGQPAIISPVGFGDRVLRGTVQKVNQYAEPTGWRQANVKEYKAYVSINDPSDDLRTGMTASVTIRCDEVPNAIQVPVQSVYSHGDKFYCFAYAGGQWEAKEIVPGPTNDKFFVVESGLNEGDKVSMNPRAYLAQVTLPKLAPEVAQRAIPQVPTDQLGGKPAGATAGAGQRRAGGRPGGGAPAGGQQADAAEPKGKGQESAQASEPQAAAAPGEGARG
ncbi:MAG: efflux RND transporter periplasmic adaptor subunit, partial [Pirellulales bacterium]